MRLILALVVSVAVVGCAHHKSSTAFNGTPAPQPNLVEFRTFPTPSKTTLAMAEVRQQMQSGLTVFFQTGSASLTAESEKQIRTIAAWMKANPGQKVIVEGHVDASGTAATNKSLADRRAARVRQLLIDRGAKAKDVEAKGYGANPTERKAVVKLRS